MFFVFNNFFLIQDCHITKLPLFLWQLARFSHQKKEEVADICYKKPKVGDNFIVREEEVGFNSFFFFLGLISLFL